ncbi:delta-1-pyrroline-5-carboxylate synthase-like isoform X2 [Dysidea avara]|uniref:delta-1-pyrroline-5-carboxylate synthase-like isoform X2 n=1 Tax=Dysidea avara TaxID=196820 RepID=UPI003320F547
MYHRVYQRFSTFRYSTIPKSNRRLSSYSNDDQQVIHRPITSRKELINCNRIVVKIGSACITRADECGVSLGRLASTVEQMAQLHNGNGSGKGKQVILVTSGAVAFGKQRLQHELLLSQSMRATLKTGKGHQQLPMEPRACAAAGQAGLMSLYEAMFAQYGIPCAQVLITQPDVECPQRLESLKQTMEELLRMKIVPILNANDAIAEAPQQDADLKQVLSIRDNDVLASLVATQLRADLLILLSDVEGIYSAPPSDPGARLLHTYHPAQLGKIKLFGSSRVGKGGMQSKIQAAVRASDGGCAVTIASGLSPKETIIDIIKGRKVGTFITPDKDNITTDTAAVADEVRQGGRDLQKLTAEQRANIISHLANMLLEKQDEILAANKKDVMLAQHTLSPSMLARLKLTPGKLQSLSNGILAIAESSLKAVGNVLQRTLISDGLELRQVTVPIGVLMVIFESRPDCLPQVSALSIATANGLMLKGGKEARYTNQCLHQIVCKAISTEMKGNPISLLDDRESVDEALSLDSGKIDLVIPRGSSELVAHINEAVEGRVPVLGHTEGICHVYVDQHADLDKAIKIVVDSKCEYPAACNSMEVLLLHSSLLQEGSFFTSLINTLRRNKVVIHPGPRLHSVLPISSDPVQSLRHEYSSLECCVEIVDSAEEAVDYINTNSSHHTDSVITENDEVKEQFLRDVDSACVFHNASTRFSDGYRFGLGAEVGISTGRIHARGPVGMEGLLSTKWIMYGDGHTVEPYNNGVLKYLHQTLSTKDCEENRTAL